MIYEGSLMSSTNYIGMIETELDQPIYRIFSLE